MIFMKRIFALVLVSVFALLLLTGCRQDDGLTRVTVNEVTHSVFYAPQYVALNKGFFEERVP